MKNAIGLALSIFLSLGSQAQLGNKMLEKALKAAAPKEPTGQEAIIKLFADAARTKEVKSITDGTTKLYFRAYIWKDRAAKGSSPSKPVGPKYCFQFKEGTVDRNGKLNGFDYADVKGTVSGNFKTYSKSHDYLDIDVDLNETQFMQYFISRNEANKSYPFTARLAGECKFVLANSNFAVDLSKGRSKYDQMAISENDGIEIKPDLYPNAKDLHDNAARLLNSTYGIASFNKLHFYKDWSATGDGSARRLSTLVTYKENGKCFVSYFKLWESKTRNGWTAPNAINQRTNYQIDCSKL